MNKNCTLILAFVLMFASVSFADPYFFRGYVHINGALAPNGTIIEAYVGSSSTPANSIILGEGWLGGFPEGRYEISIAANSGDNVSFRVNNLSLISANGTNTSAQTLSNTITENFNLSVNKSANGVNCLYAGGCTSGYCVDSYCCNSACSGASEDCNVAGSLGTCTSTATGTGGVSGGGGGAGAVVVTETVTVASVTAGATATVSVAQSASLGIEKIEFTAANSVSSVQVTVKETTASEAGVSVAISSAEGAVYKYLEITKNIRDADVSSAKINFKVPRSWLNSNNVNKQTVALNRFVNNAWSKLSTTISSEDSTYVYYSATSPGFSVFAITGEKTRPSACGNSAIDSGEECDGTNLAGQTCVSKGYASGTLGCVSCRFDISGCLSAPTPPAACGNNIQEGIEECDGTDLAGQTCISKGYAGGTLKCTSCSFDTSGCTGAPPAVPIDYTVAGIAVVIIIVAAVYLMKRTKGRKPVFREYQGKKKK